MKNIILLLGSIFLLNACVKLDLNPLSQGSSGNWYSTQSQLEMSVAQLYLASTWNNASNAFDYYNTDDWTYRTVTTSVNNGTMNGQDDEVNSIWSSAYNCIANANLLLNNIYRSKTNITEEKYNMYVANAKFARAAQYAKLIFQFGDVPFYTKPLNIDEAFSLSRTKKDIILDSIYVDYDFAAQYLPVNSGSNNFPSATKGAALAMKARIALYMRDFSTALDAAKACMDLQVYTLYSDYGNLFLPIGRNSVETIFAIPSSTSLGHPFPLASTDYVPRYAGGFGNEHVSWDLFCSYLCSDGLPIDKSPLFSPREPFKNRDPRCAMTLVEWGTVWFGYPFQPHPDSLTIKNISTGIVVPNRMNRAVDKYASYNGLIVKKFVYDDWAKYIADNDHIIIRYADVLLIYAEAKIELGEIDETVLNAINMVRARAYGVDYTQTTSYPAVTTTSPSELRGILRTERRMEFAIENDLRYNDIIRWRLAGKVLNRPNYGMLDPVDLEAKVVKPGLWFFPEIPKIDEDGTPDFTSMYNNGLIKLLAQRKFDTTRQYLWPIPSKEIIINKNLTQNPGY